MKHLKLILPFAILIIAASISSADAQTTMLRYGQIPSTIKTVSALQLYIAERKSFSAAKASPSAMSKASGKLSPHGRSRRTEDDDGGGAFHRPPIA